MGRLVRVRTRNQNGRDEMDGVEVRMEVGDAALVAFDQLGNPVIVVRAR